jgi:hypothetical protein
MSISRRKLLKISFALTTGIASLFAVENANPIRRPQYMGYTLHDDVSVSLLKRYASSLALQDKDARMEAQRMFHEAQLARWRGGTMGMKLGSQHRVFVERQERKSRQLMS